MEAVDWSMNDRSSGLIDWRTASTVGARLASAGAPLTDLDRARLDDDFAEAVPKAEALVVGRSELGVVGAPRGQRPAAAGDREIGRGLPEVASRAGDGVNLLAG